MIFHFVLILLVSIALTGLIRYYALSRKILDMPNQRSSHTVPTPRGGGLAIVLAFVCSMLLLVITQGLDAKTMLVFLSALLVAGIGFFDDHGHVPARWRFLTHLLAAMLVMVLLHGMPLLLLPAPLDWMLDRSMVDLSWLGYAIGVFLLVWFLNLFNFMDGTDGIAASESLFVATALAGYAFYLDRTLCFLAISLAAASLGFLGWNWPKAKIFMGDVGSGFLGLLLGILVLMAAQQAAVMLYCGLILFGIFVVDATYTLLYRFCSKQKWYEAHCSHTFQRAAKQYGHLPVLLACWVINLFWLLPISLLVFLYPAYALLGMALAYSPLLFLAYLFKAGQADWNQS